MSSTANLAAVGLKEAREYSHETHDEELEKNVMDFCYDKFYEVAKEVPRQARSL